MAKEKKVVKASIDQATLKAVQAGAKQFAEMNAKEIRKAVIEQASAVGGTYRTLVNAAFREGMLGTSASFEPTFNDWFLTANGETREQAKAAKRPDQNGDLSAYNAWHAAGKVIGEKSWLQRYVWEAFAFKNVSLPRRAAVVRALVKREDEPDAKKWEEMKPTPDGGSTGGGTLKGQTAAIERTIIGFGKKSLSKMGDDQLVIYNRMVKDAGTLKAWAAELPVEKKPGTPPKTTAADDKAAVLAALQARLAKAKGEKPPKLDA